MNALREAPRIRLWMKLAAAAAIGIVLMKAVHLLVVQRIATRALAREQVALGRRIARLVAQDLTEPLLVGDTIQLHEIATGVTSSSENRIAYCIVVNGGRVLASSLPVTPDALVRARPAGYRDPLVIDRDGTRVLEITEPVLDGAVGEVRIAFAMETLRDARRELALQMGLVAFAMIGVGLVASFVMGRRIARPVEEMLTAVDRFDPARDAEVPTFAPHGSDEIAMLANRLHLMMRRLRTAHVEAEEARQKSCEAQRMATIGALTAGVAHEVNNPLAGLLNCVRWFERSDLPESKRREYLAHMRSSLQRIAAVVQRLLDFGRPRPISLAPADVADLAREAIELVRPALDERRVACALEEDAGRGLVHADRHEIGQALVNLLLNAAYVTADGGQIRIRLVTRNGFRGISVIDDGPGIAPEIRDRILDPFFTTKPEGEGTGLGLSVTRAVIDAHRGELTFEFPETRGTVATVWLRAGDAKRAAV